MPLLELATGPEIDHPEDGKHCIKEIVDLLQALEISDAKMKNRD
jgi:Asp-tRNA(Asn)/Glu-tRNA(Gln) amidotransferase B subunit